MLVPSEAFSVRVVSSNGAAHLRLSGRFDLAAVSSLDDLIGQTQRLDVVMDLGDVTFMDGAAWLAVMDFEHRAHDWGKELRLVNPRPRPQDLRAHVVRPPDRGHGPATERPECSTDHPDEVNGRPTEEPRRFRVSR